MIYRIKFWIMLCFWPFCMIFVIKYAWFIYLWNILYDVSYKVALKRELVEEFV